MLNLYLLLFVYCEVAWAEKCPVNICGGTYSTPSAVENFCKNETSGSYMSGRCCIMNETDSIIGLDLSSCGIESLNITGGNFTDLIIMDVRHNELSSVAPRDLVGLLNLTYLYLPYWISCPGGKQAWNETHLNETYCYLPLNPCEYLNISCTENGNCIYLGPGSAKCICKPGHYGYKCMNVGEFPAKSFSISLSITTVILSIILWFAHGRDAYKPR